MEMLIAFLAFAFLLVLLFLVLVFYSYQLYFSPKAIRAAGFAKRAKLDYETARGTAQLKVLREARNRKGSALNQANQKLSMIKDRMANLEKEQQQKLTEALERHIAYTQLTEVKGIGSKMRERILATTFRSRLSDLTQAYRVQGVGEARQQAINQWIREYTQHLPLLMNEDFPRKRDIIDHYQKQLTELKNQTSSLTVQRDRLNDLLRRLQAPIATLELAKMSDFVRAMQDPAFPRDMVDDHLVGIFPEWEPVPEWFKEMIATEVA